MRTNVCAPSALLLICLLGMLLTAQATSAQDAAAPAVYDISLTLDFNARSFVGTERLRWTNNGTKAAAALYFHLYPNQRAQSLQSVPEKSKLSHDQELLAMTDEPRLLVTSVRAVDNGAAGSTGSDQNLQFSLDDGETLLRVALHRSVAPGSSVELLIAFNGTVPDIDPEQTGILAHVVQQVDAALRSAREFRRARDINFYCRDLILLGAAYPILAAKNGEDWQRKLELSIGDPIFADSADYRVSLTCAQYLHVYSSAGTEVTAAPAAAATSVTRVYSGQNLRNFALVAGGNLRAEERTVAGLTVRSVFQPEQEKIGRRILTIAADAVNVFSTRFGPLPYRQVTVIQTPLVAGNASLKFAGAIAVASAFYVDFDSAAIRNLPELIRDQRDSVEDSLEWTTAHAVAQQWWGMAVGNDPERSPVLDEALSNWSALLYYHEVHGEARAEMAQDDQLRGVYKVYRTFGGADMSADKPAREYRNFFQYAAIVNSKGALMFTELRKSMGDENFFQALTGYYRLFKFKIAELDDLRSAFTVKALNPEQRRAIERLFNRWLSSKRGDEDIAAPDGQLASSLGLPERRQRKNDRNAFTKLGKFFWQQMTRIR